MLQIHKVNVCHYLTCSIRRWVRAFSNKPFLGSPFISTIMPVTFSGSQNIWVTKLGCRQGGRQQLFLVEHWDGNGDQY